MGLRRAARAPPDSPVLSGRPTFSSDTDVTSCGRGGAEEPRRQAGRPLRPSGGGGGVRLRSSSSVRPEVAGSRPGQCTWVWVWKQVWVWREPGPVGGLQLRAGPPRAASRRAALSLGLGLGLGSLATTPLAGSPALAAPPSRPPSLEDVPRFRRTANGVRYEDVIEGSGSEAKPGDSVQFNYVCRRSNGYFVYSTVDPFSGEAQPATLPLGEGKMILGLEEVLYGMRPGAPELEYLWHKLTGCHLYRPNMQARGELWSPPQPDMSALTWNRNPRSSVLADHSTRMQRSRWSLKSSCLKSYDWLARDGADGCGGARSMGSAVPHRSG
eukprot:SM000129S26132  [mRNA]  locus=s129:82002:84558:+ [translate_table: standard]